MAKVDEVLRLISEGLNVNEIQEVLQIDNREFSSILKHIRDLGYSLKKNVFSDGTMTLKIDKTLNFNPNNTMRINVKDRVFRAIFISDLHLGSIFERPDLLKTVIDFASKHDIHIVFNCGDVIENIYPDNPHPLVNKTVESQMRKVVRVMPYNPSILYLNLYGNHDYRSIIDRGLDISKYIEDKRHDIITLGYGESTIRLKDDAIGITHDIKRTRKNEVPGNITTMFRGHSHKSKTRDNRNSKIIYVPALSEGDGSAYEYRPLLGFLVAEFIFFDKRIARENISQYAIVNKEIRLANEETMIINPDYQDRSNKPKTLSKKKGN